MKTTFIVVPVILVVMTATTSICGDPPANPDAQEAFHEAIRNEDMEGLKRAIRHGADVDYGTYPPILCASMQGRQGLVDVLLRAGANPNAGNYNSPLYLAAANGHTRIVTMLLESGAAVNGTHGSPLYAAAGNGYVDIVKLLLKAGANVNAMEESRGGRTPLHGAVQRDHYEVAELLVAAGADLNVRDRSGRRPVSYVSYKSLIREKWEALLTPKEPAATQPAK